MRRRCLEHTEVVTPPEPTFSVATQRVLASVGDRFHTLGAGSQFEMFAIVRAALEQLGQADAFYVAFYGEPGTIDLPYVSHRGRFVGTDQLLYPEGSLAQRLRDHRATYEYVHDNGHLIHRGLPIGDATPTLDAVAVPMQGIDGPTGFICVQSESAKSFGAEFVASAEYLTRLLYRELRYVDETEADLALLERYPQMDPYRVTGVEPAIAVQARMGRLRELAAEIEAAAQAGDLDQVVRLSRRSADLCDRYASELVLAVAPSRQEHPSWTGLTDRQREVAELLERGLSNDQIARELVVSVGTVKSHVSAVLRRLQVRNRRDLIRSRIVRPASSSG